MLEGVRLAGIHYVRRRSEWQVYIVLEGGQIGSYLLGFFETLETRRPAL